MGQSFLDIMYDLNFLVLEETKSAIFRNKIREIPADIEKLTKLETLNLAFNLLTSIPTSVSKLRALK